MFRRSPALVAFVALLLAGCTSAGAAAPATPTATVEPTPTPTATPEPTPTGFVQSYEQCKAVVQPELDVLAEISTRLTTTGGINVKDYGPLVETIPLSDMDRLPGGTNRFCRNVAVQDVASASLDHMQASDGWSNCLSFPSSWQQPCIDMIVQRWWAKATNDYNKALMDMTSLQQGAIPPLDPDPIYDQESPKPSHTPDELATLACQREYTPAISDLFELGRALAEGTNLTNYGAWLNAASDDLAKVDTSGLDGTCLVSVGAVVRTIVNDHMDARDAWRACNKQKTQAKWDACNAKNIQPIWSGRLTADYTKLFDAMGTMYIYQTALLRPAWLPHASP
jgi:hypothetical protein